jgi:hypothetical protein
MSDRPLANASVSRICILAIAVLVPSPLAASIQAPAPEPEEIVVSVERLSPAQARERAIAYVRSAGVINGKESIARWIDPVCPRVVGTTPEQAQFIVTRLRAIAAKAGVPAANSGCLPNISINFVSDGAAFVRSVAARGGRRLAEVPPQLRPALLNGRAPVRWWYSTETRGRDGDRAMDMDAAAVSPGEGMAGTHLPGNGESSVVAQYNSSLVSTLATRAIRQATVVIDTARAQGATVDAIAAYAAVVAFAELQPREMPPVGSILGLFGSDPPPTLTKLDLTFLRELYSLPLDRKSRQQRARLVRALQYEVSSF